MKFFKILGVITILFFFALPAMAQEASPEEAKAMVQRAALYIKAHGKSAAIAEFNKSSSGFIDRDLYVFAIDRDGVFLAHPIRPSFVGKNVIDLQDIEGTFLIRNFLEIEREGWSAYKWSHPVTKEIRPKKSYIINLGDYVIGAGAYYEE